MLPKIKPSRLRTRKELRLLLLLQSLNPEGSKLISAEFASNPLLNQLHVW